MTKNSLSRFVITVALLVASSVASHAQSSSSQIGPSGAEVAGVVAGVAGVTVLILYLTLHKPAIVGCVQAADGTNRLINEKDKRTYTLAGDHLKAGNRFKLKGKKVKEKDGSFAFRVNKVDQDYGACIP